MDAAVSVYIIEQSQNRMKIRQNILREGIARELKIMLEHTVKKILPIIFGAFGRVR